MTKVFLGHCPKQADKNYPISVNYIDVSDSGGRKFIRGLMNCEAGKYGCDINPCPILEKAPKEIP